MSELVALQYIALTVLVGAAVGISHYYIEELGFQLCQLLARRGQMRRLAPGTKRLYQVTHPSIDVTLPQASIHTTCLRVLGGLSLPWHSVAHIQVNPMGVPLGP